MSLNDGDLWRLSAPPDVVVMAGHRLLGDPQTRGWAYYVGCHIWSTEMDEASLFSTYAASEVIRKTLNMRTSCVTAVTIKL